MTWLGGVAGSHGRCGTSPGRRRQKGRGTKRHGKIREALKQVFDTGQVNTKWLADFDWLFDLRDAALHAEEKPRPPVPHPLGTNTARENVDYSIESAERAVDRRYRF